MKVGIIGLGAMGAGMAANLHRAGHLRWAWNRTRRRGEAVAAAHGLPLAEGLAQLAGDCGLVLTSLSADRDLIEVTGRLAGLLRPGTILLDTSTVAPATAREVGEALAGSGVRFLDAPVSGGREGAEAGTLAMMVGGDPQTLETIRPLLGAIASRVVHMGPVGAGQATKAVNQLMAAGINQAVSEALAFGETQGLPMGRVIEVLSEGAAGSWFLAHRGTSMLAGDFTPGFRVALHHKDLEICQAMAQAAGGRLPIGEMTLVHYRRLIEAGHGDEDISALIRLKRRLFGEDHH